mgnify:CR=1 FL=1
MLTIGNLVDRLPIETTNLKVRCQKDTHCVTVIEALRTRNGIDQRMFFVKRLFRQEFFIWLAGTYNTHLLWIEFESYLVVILADVFLRLFFLDIREKTEPS